MSQLFELKGEVKSKGGGVHESLGIKGHAARFAPPISFPSLSELIQLHLLNPGFDPAIPPSSPGIRTKLTFQ
jgi:hypothetical protein